ncbi:MAG: hypothetical protein AMXMBFR13_48080 [Phycisphaerae bacterium]
MEAISRAARTGGAARRRGFTLYEVLLAASLSAGIALGVGHVVTQLTRGAASVDRRSQAQTEASLALLRLRSELEHATYVTDIKPKKIVFRHPDADGDGSVDTITYEWSGISGDPLTRKSNDAAAEPILTECQDFIVAANAPAIRLIAGQRYNLKMEYYDNTGSAVARLRWSSPSLSLQAIPQSQLYPAFTEAGANPPTTTGAGTGIIGEYYQNMDFTNLVLVRRDSSINFDWGSGSPSALISSNTFSVRWTGQVKAPATNDYTFYTVSDDGVRLWLDGRLIIDNWKEHPEVQNRAYSTGVRSVGLHIKSGPANGPVQLEGSVNLLNRPPYGD